MKFFTKSEIPLYYDKPFEEVSPTDSPKERYMCGDETFECPECNQEIGMECNEAFLQREKGHGTGGQGFTERAYCQDCQIEYKRYREPVIDTTDYKYPYNRVDEREEYVCSDCKNRHPFTALKDEVKYTTNPVIRALESVGLVCPCGSITPINNLNFEHKTSCENCNRTFEFIVS